jgi:hypothetical protein
VTGRPFKVTVRLPAGIAARRARLLVGTAQPAVALGGGAATFEIATVLDHEVVVLE